MLNRVLVVAVAVLLASATPASAEFGQEPDNTNTTTVSGAATDDGGAAFVDSLIGRKGRTAHHRGSGSRIVCEYSQIDSSSPLGGLGESGVDLVEGMSVWRICRDAAGSVVSGEIITIGPVNPRALALLAVERAIADLSVELPVAESSPANHLTVPNIDTWFWVTNTAPESASATAGTVSATVHSTFTGARFESDGQSVQCAGGGQPYDLAQPDDRQHSACVIRFGPPQRHVDVDVTATWHLTWTATNGQIGDLGDVERTATIPLEIHELHSVIRNR